MKSVFGFRVRLQNPKSRFRNLNPEVEVIVLYLAGSNNNNNNNNSKTLNRVKRTTKQLHAHVILSFNANPTNWNNEPLAENFNARAQGFF